MKGPNMIRVMLTAVALAVSGAALATIPPPVLDEAAKAKAAEAAAKTAWQGKMDAFQLCKAQDRVAAVYRKTAAAKPAAAATPAGAPAAAAAPAKPVATPATASQGGGTPVAAVAPAVSRGFCAGAHSPTATAASPPSVRPNSAEMAPSKPGVATKK